MQKFTRILMVASLPLWSLAQNGPIDFEPNGHGANWTWTVFENDSNPSLEIVANPDPTGINTSATVAKFTALQAGNPWAGCETSHGAGTGSFVIDASNAQIRIMVWKSEISDVGIKLVRPDSWSLGEIKVPNTKVGEWEQLVFDFSSHIGLTPAYDQLVIFPDFNARNGDQIIYFDNVFGAAATVGVPENIFESASLYPNPGNDHLVLDNIQESTTVSIYTATGSLIHEGIIEAGKHSLNTASWQKGLYVIRLSKNGNAKSFQWIKN